MLIKRYVISLLLGIVTGLLGFNLFSGLNLFSGYFSKNTLSDSIMYADKPEMGPTLASENQWTIDMAPGENKLISYGDLSYQSLEKFINYIQSYDSVLYIDEHYLLEATLNGKLDSLIEFSNINDNNANKIYTPFNNLFDVEKLANAYDLLYQFFLIWKVMPYESFNSDLWILHQVFLLVVFFHLFFIIMVIILIEQFKLILSSHQDKIKNQWIRWYVNLIFKIKFSPYGIIFLCLCTIPSILTFRFVSLEWFSLLYSFYLSKQL